MVNEILKNRHKKQKKRTVSILDIVRCGAICIDVILYICVFATLREVSALKNPTTTEINPVEISVVEETVKPVDKPDTPIIAQPKFAYISLDVPYIDSSFKAYMDYRKITNKSSNQYKFINQNAWTDEQGFMRCNTEIEDGQAYYLIALGSYYGTEIGTKYRITTDKGNVFYGVLAECKADIHTNPTNQYTVVGTQNIVEFLVNPDVLNKEVKYHGTANRYEPLSGKIIKIERIELLREC